MTRAESQAVKNARLEQKLAAQTRELAELKAAHAEQMKGLAEGMKELSEAITPLTLAGPRLLELLEQAERQKGMVQLARYLLGGTVVTTIITAIAGVFHFFSRGG